MGKKLEKEVITEMVKMREEGKTLQEIGEKFGVSRQRINQIFRSVTEAQNRGFDYYARKNHYCSKMTKDIKFVGLRRELEEREISLLYLCKRANVEYEKVRKQFKLGRLPANPENINRIIKFLDSTYEKLFMEVDKDSQDQ